MEHAKLIQELKQLQSELEVMKVETIKKKQNQFLRIEKAQYTLKNGNMLVREQLRKGNQDGSAAIVIAITEEKKILFVMQPRVLKEKSGSLELPAGYIEDNENGIDAGVRELIEETGYVPKQVELLTQFYQDSGISGAKNMLFIATGCTKEQNQHLDIDEYITVVELELEEAFYLFQNGWIDDGNSMIGMYQLKEKRKEWKL